MASVLTFTGYTGPAHALTAKTFSNVTKYIIDLQAMTLTIEWSDAQGPHVTTFDYYDISDLTDSVVEGISTSITATNA